jgi:phosphate starvation-inducible PhoH-like protein
MLNRFVIKCTNKPIIYTDRHLEYKKHLENNTSIVIASGCAGTGKTMLACQFAMNALNEKKYKKLIITRPAVSVKEELGFLPGDVHDKMKPWLIPMFEQMEKFSNKALLGKYIKEETIEIVPIAFMRGRTFEDSIIIADEMQNTSDHQMYTFLTRLGSGSKTIITGDVTQCDASFVFEENGLASLLHKLHNAKFIDENHIKHIAFDEEDVFRSEIVKYIMTLYNKN